MTSIIHRPFASLRLFEGRWHLMPTRDAARSLCGAWIPLLAPRLAEPVRRDQQCDACWRAAHRPYPKEQP